MRHIHASDYYAPVLGELEYMILLAVVRLGNGTYGAAIRREIRERTGRDLAEGSVYMTLARLEEKKMVASYVGLPAKQRGGRRRRHYLIDKEGERALGRAWRTMHLIAEGLEERLAGL